MQASTSRGDAEGQLAAFIRKFSPLDQRLIRAVRTALRKRFPTANELVYDSDNFFVIGYSPTERPSDAIVSMAARANGVGLCFITAPGCLIPNKVLLGSGNQTRFIRIDSPQAWTAPRSRLSSRRLLLRRGTPPCRRPRDTDYPLRFCEAAPAQHTAATCGNPVIPCRNVLKMEAYTGLGRYEKLPGLTCPRIAGF